MSETEDLLLVRRRDLRDLLQSVDLLALKFETLLVKLRQGRSYQILAAAQPARSETRAPAQLHTTGKKTCWRCGRELDTGSRFCDICGERVGT